MRTSVCCRVHACMARLLHGCCVAGVRLVCMMCGWCACVSCWCVAGVNVSCWCVAGVHVCHVGAWLVCMCVMLVCGWCACESCWCVAGVHVCHVGVWLVCMCVMLVRGWCVCVACLACGWFVQMWLSSVPLHPFTNVPAPFTNVPAPFTNAPHLRPFTNPLQPL